MPDAGGGKTAPSQPPSRLSLAQIFAFSATSLPTSALVIGIAIFLQPHLARNLGVPLMVVAGALFTVLLLDFGIDLVLGLLMDRTHWKIGRYRVWFVAGVPILAGGVALLFFTQRGVTAPYLVASLFVLYLGLSIITLAHAAWSATVVTSYNERSRVYGLMAPMGIVGSIAALLFPVISAALHGTSTDAVHWMGWFIILLLPVTALIVVASIPEPIAPDAKKKESAPIKEYWELVKKPSFLRLLFGEAFLVLGPGWMSNIYIFFFTSSRGFTEAQASILLVVYVIAGVIGAPVTGWLAMKFGKHRALIATTSAYSLGLCTVMITPKADIVAALPTLFWCGFMAAGFNLMTRAMTADFGDEIRLEQGKERITLLYAGTGLAAKLAGASAGIFTASVLTWVGFDPKLAHNTPEAIRGLELAYIVGPIVFVMLGGLCFLGWNLNAEKHSKIRAELDARDALYAEAPIIESVTAADQEPPVVVPKT